jgi:hypothetical protein
MPGELLGQLRVHATLGKAADKRMPQGVKSHHAPRTIDHGQEV